jgi:oxaloacetate decarboxylase alpha subunit
MAGFSGQPPVETLAYIFSETNYAANLDMAAIERVSKYFEELAPQRRPKSADTASIDPDILRHQIPGGMISNFRSQLAMQNALDKLGEVQKEVTRVREELGWPPLVTPTSQIVGTQAVMNILSGERYKMIPNEIKDYVRGLYGRSPAPMNAKLVKKILGAEKPITHRPADKLAPMLRTATEGVDGNLIEHEEDILSYCLLPEPALAYFKWRKLPPAERPEIPADTEMRKLREDAAAPKSASGIASSQQSGAVAQAMETDRLLQDDDRSTIESLLEKAHGLLLSELTIRKGDFCLTLRGTGAAADTHAVQHDAKRLTPSEKISTLPQPAAPAAAGQNAAVVYKNVIKSPLVGTFYATATQGKDPFVKVGDAVKAGDTVCIVEAMKLFNEIKAVQSGKIAAVLVKNGDSVQKDQPLIAFEP